jgi:hypothetical protein
MSGSAYKLKCPHCRHGIRVRNSVSLHPLLRAAYLQCTNVNCGSTFRGQFEITHQMSPSACPSPDVNLPLADAAIRHASVERENDRQVDIDDILTPPVTQ